MNLWNPATDNELASGMYKSKVKIISIPICLIEKNRCSFSVYQNIPKRFQRHFD